MQESTIKSLDKVIEKLTLVAVTTIKEGRCCDEQDMESNICEMFRLNVNRLTDIYTDDMSDFTDCMLKELAISVAKVLQEGE